MSLTSPCTLLPRSLLPSRIWVCLDCARGLVTFLHADTGVKIFTFPPASFKGETLRPWFWVETEETQLCLRAQWERGREKAPKRDIPPHGRPVGDRNGGVAAGGGVGGPGPAVAAGDGPGNQRSALSGSSLLSLEAHQDGGIRVVCGSAGWYPQPEVLWKAANGQRLPSVSQRRSSDERGLFEIQDVVVVSGKGDGNLSCVVRNSRLEQEQASSLHISAPFFHNARHWMAALGVFLVLSVVSFGVITYLWRRKVGLSRTLGESFWPLPPAKPPEKGAPWEGRGSGWLLIALWSLVWVDGAQKGSGEHWGWERGPGGDLTHGEKWGPVISQLKSG
ncbi:uncharacterized protein LOC141735097 [Larus michahellis]|uniref:uncharacterized protein LOC141735097 n=1 Tax=Larus michahellis TaxID=119627 RepID=UPI003D9B7699